MNNAKGKSSWGGVRVGAGRKASVSTKGKQMWIPSSLVVKVAQLIEEYKNQSFESNTNESSESPALTSPSARECAGGSAVPYRARECAFDDPVCNTGYMMLSEPPDLSLNTGVSYEKDKSEIKIPDGYCLADRKALERLPNSVKRQLSKRFGSLTNAVNAKIYTNGKRVLEVV